MCGDKCTPGTLRGDKDEWKVKVFLCQWYHRQLLLWLRETERSCAAARVKVTARILRVKLGWTDCEPRLHQPAAALCHVTFLRYKQLFNASSLSGVRFHATVSTNPSGSGHSPAICKQYEMKLANRKQQLCNRNKQQILLALGAYIHCSLCFYYNIYSTTYSVLRHVCFIIS